MRSHVKDGALAVFQPRDHLHSMEHWPHGQYVGFNFVPYSAYIYSNRGKIMTLLCALARAFAFSAPCWSLLPCNA